MDILYFHFPVLLFLHIWPFALCACILDASHKLMLSVRVSSELILIILMCILVSVVLTGEQPLDCCGVRQQFYGCTAGSTPTIQTSEGENLETEFMLTVKSFIGGKRTFSSLYMFKLLDCYHSLWYAEQTAPVASLNWPQVCLWTQRSCWCLRSVSEVLEHFSLHVFRVLILPCPVCLFISEWYAEGNIQGWKAVSLPVILITLMLVVYFYQPRCERTCCSSTSIINVLLQTFKLSEI